MHLCQYSALLAGGQAHGRTSRDTDFLPLNPTQELETLAVNQPAAIGDSAAFWKSFDPLGHLGRVLAAQISRLFEFDQSFDFLVVQNDRPRLGSV